MNAMPQRPDAATLGLVLTGGGARAGVPGRGAQGHRRAARARRPEPLSGGHRHLRGRGQRHCPRIRRRSLPPRRLHHREGMARIPRAPRDQGGRGQRAAVGSAMDSGAHHRGWLVHPPRSLFDNTPLWELLRKNLQFEGIPRGMYKQHLRAVGICATSYSDADSVTFYACSGRSSPGRGRRAKAPGSSSPWTI